MIYLRPKKKPCPQPLIYFISFLYIVILSLIVLSFVFEDIRLYCWLGIGCLVTFIFICNRYFAWYSIANIVKSGNTLQYNYTGLLDTLGNNDTLYTISNITSFKLMKNYVLVRGSIKVKEFMQSEKSIKSCKIYDYTDEVIKLLNDFKSK